MTPGRRSAALLAFSIGALGRRTGKNVAVGCALALVCAAFSSVILLTDALREEARRELHELPDITVARMRGGRPALLDPTDAARVRAIPAVASAQARVWGYLFVEGLNSNLVIVGVTDQQVGRWIARITRGTAPRPGSRGWVLLGEGVLRILGALPGDVIGMGAGGDLTVAGAFRSEAALTTADVAVMDERDARAVLGMAANEATDLAIALTNPDEAAVASRRISAELPGARVVERRSLARAYDLTYGTRGGLMALALLPALLALLVLAWDRATGLSAEERREVGVLKTVGWSTRDVVATKLTEAALVATIAGIVGALASYAYVFVFHAPGLLRALLGWSSLYPTFQLTPAADGTSLATLAAITALPYIAAAAIPAWRAATLDPSDVLRDA